MSVSLPARANAELIDTQYLAWQQNPNSVDASWAAFFEGFELGLVESKRRKDSPQQGAVVSGGASAPEAALAARAKLVTLVYTFRALGHTSAWIDPLADSAPQDTKLTKDLPGFSEAELADEVSTQFYAGGEKMKLSALIERLSTTYCGYIGYEFMHIHGAETRNWIRDKVENRRATVERSDSTKRRVLDWLVEADSFEQFLHKKYVGQKRFSLEGGDALMVSLNAIFEQSPDHGIAEIVMGMAHRGRLNVLANYLKKPLPVLFNEFQDNYVPNLVGGDGDVKYHLGYDTVRKTEGGAEVAIHLAANPSHLEAVNAVVEGKARARQRALDDELNRSKVVPVLVHGDAAFAGQGTVAELLNLSQLPGYRTGGTIHLVVNNQIGFTTSPEDARSSDYCTDVAKMIDAPVFHVNGDHPLEVLFATELALEFRQKFAQDVVIDIVCYRRHGHNEGDEPAFTQPMYAREIADHPRPAQVFRDRLINRGDMTAEQADEIVTAHEQRMESQLVELDRLQENPGESIASSFGSSAVEQPEFTFTPVPTGLAEDRFKAIGVKLADIPAAFNLNGKVKRTVVDRRLTATQNGGPFDWGAAEILAFGSLVTEGHPVRLSGQDCKRGTFSHRHAVFYDTENRERFIPLEHLSPGRQAPFRAYNSLLSEAAVLSFDYGYSLYCPEQLTIWEAQFGDFANGAQVIIDQFISSAESKWGQPSNIVLLLPHGYEGQGPEHSSARLERFLQLCAERNMQVCNVTKPAQYFHLLRRQVKRNVRKPLILMTPKSLLRHKEAVSHQADFAPGTAFQEILDDDQLVDKPNRVTRLIFCTGKVYYDLLNYRNEHELKNVAIIRLEQIYPLAEEALQEIVSRYTRANKKWVWCQEEPLNMGAWTFIGPRLKKLNDGSRVRYAGRDRSASPATGSKAVHTREQKALVEEAFNV